LKKANAKNSKVSAREPLAGKIARRHRPRWDRLSMRELSVFTAFSTLRTKFGKQKRVGNYGLIPRTAGDASDAGNKPGVERSDTPGIRPKDSPAL